MRFFLELLVILCFFLELLVILCFFLGTSGDSTVFCPVFFGFSCKSKKSCVKCVGMVAFDQFSQHLFVNASIHPSHSLPNQSKNM